MVHINMDKERVIDEDTLRKSNMAMETPYIWRLMAGNIVYTPGIFNCHVWLPEGTCINFA